LDSIVESKDVEFIEDKFYNDSKTVSNPTQIPEINLNTSSSQENKRKKSLGLN
jgi:hypothetical protein